MLLNLEEHLIKMKNLPILILPQRDHHEDLWILPDHIYMRPAFTFRKQSQYPVVLLTSYMIVIFNISVSKFFSIIVSTQFFH